MMEPQKTLGRGLSRREFLKLSGVVSAGALAASYPVMIERYLIGVNTYRIPIARLPDAFHGFTIIHLTDIHYGSLVPLELVAYVVRRANNLRHDITVCTGDYVHKNDLPDPVNEVWPVLSRLEAPSGVYSVLGNHDHWASTRRSVYWLKQSKQNLRQQAVPIQRGGQRIWLGGVGDLWEDAPSIDDAFHGLPPGECKIVLAHNPDTADLPHQTRIDLMISGHTHGGQVRLPFLGPPVLPVKNKRYSSGIIDTQSMKLFISRGIGWAGYPVRFNCPPEIAMLVLEKADEASG